MKDFIFWMSSSPNGLPRESIEIRTLVFHEV